MSKRQLKVPESFVTQVIQPSLIFALVCGIIYAIVWATS